MGGAGIPFGRVLGIPIRLDLSFFLAFAVIVFLLSTQWIENELPDLSVIERWLYAVGGGVVFFAALLVHELAHSLTARRYGMEVSSITLYVFGGVSLIKEDSRRPGHEFWISIVGPLASLLIGIAFLALAAWVFADDTALQVVGWWVGVVNIFLAVFNMLPGYPLDGGRVVRSLVWRTTGSRHRATRAAARLGQGLGLALIVFGAAGMLFNLGGFGDGFSGIWLIFIGILLATQAAQGVRAAELERDLESLSVSDMMLAPPQARTVEADLPVRTLVPARPQLDHRDLFIVGEQGVAVGIASASAILLLDEERYQSVRMRDVMTRADQIQPIGPGASGDEALRRLQQEHVFALPVVEAGRLLGVVGLDQIVAALRDAAPGSRGV